jgi:uncharacterized protein (TIGR02145 family)
MIKRVFLSTLILFLVCEIYSQQYGSFTNPQDRQIYKTVIIGNQVWMTENLNVDKFRNGDPIPQVENYWEWKEAGYKEQPAWCYYQNDANIGVKYGKLYNWYAVNDPRGLAPNGWHIPSDAEWTVLTDYLGGNAKAGAKMKQNIGWFGGGNGTNSSGFSGIPGGYRDYHGRFDNSVLDGFWWSSSYANRLDAWGRGLHYSSDFIDRYSSYKYSGWSVRCIRD